MLRALNHTVNQTLRAFATAPNKLVHLHVQDGIAKITMSDPKTRNSLSLAMMQQLIDAISQHQHDTHLRTIVLTGEGPVFSAGHNLKELSSQHAVEDQLRVFHLAADLMNTIIDCPVPVIARVDGLAAAAGCQLVAQCDLAFCSKRSTFSTPGVNFGIFCSTPGVALARTVPKMTAMKMLFTGLPVSGEEAAAAGLVSGVCEDVDAEIGTVCEAIADKSRAVVALGKQFYHEQVGVDVRTAYALGGRKMVDNLQMRDGREGVDSFIGKRKPVWGHFVE